MKQNGKGGDPRRTIVATRDLRSRTGDRPYYSPTEDIGAEDASNDVSWKSVNGGQLGDLRRTEVRDVVAIRQGGGDEDVYLAVLW